MRRTFSQLLADVHRTANLLADVGVGRTDAVALIAPNCAQLITATLAAQLAGIAAPINGALSADHVTELVQRSGQEFSSPPHRSSIRTAGIWPNSWPGAALSIPCWSWRRQKANPPRLCLR